MAEKKSSLGAMRGLDLDAVIAGAARTIEDSESDEIVVTPRKQSRHTTRASRGTVNPMPIYSSKYHPIDDVTRPNSAQVRRRSMAVSSATCERDDEDDDDDESLDLSSLQTLSEAEDDSEASEEGIKPRKSQRRLGLTPRTPNPRSTRHSSRNEAKKLVSYSTKHHPQDYALPGYRHRAVETVNSSTEASLGSLKRKARQQENVEDIEDNTLDELPANERRRPRKKLKSLGRGQATQDLAARRDRQSKNNKARADTPIHIESDSSDLSEVDEELISGSQPTKWKATTEDDISPEHDVLETLDNSNPRLAEFRKLMSPLSLLEEYAKNPKRADSLTPPLELPPSPAPHATFVPEYIKSRISLNGGNPASLTKVTLLDNMLADYRSGSHGELSIHRPYLNFNPSPAGDISGGPQPDQNPSRDLSLSPYIEAFEVSEFEEQMAITDSSGWHAINTRPPPPESSQLATSDPIHLLMTQPPIVDDEDLPSTARPSSAMSGSRNQ